MATDEKRQAEDYDSIWELIAAYLLLKHRRRQEEIADETRARVIRSYRSLNFGDLDGTQFAWIDGLLPGVRRGYEDSQKATVSFLEDYRALRVQQLGLDEQPRPKIITARQAATTGLAVNRVRSIAPEFNEGQTAARLLATGPARVKKSMPAPADQAMAKGLKGAMGSAVQAAMQGGREVAQQEFREDRLVTGFQRITDSDPCYFCALLAANGPVSTRVVYRSANSFSGTNSKFAPNAAFVATGEPDGIAKVHDHCCCVLAPVYEGEFQMTEAARVGGDLWSQVYRPGSGQSPTEALKNYRRLYESLRRDSGPLGDPEPDIRSALALIGDDAALRPWAKVLAA
ncbi:capsid maturation protease [Gordonia phage Rabbitrun]|uniref:Capsid maturation protease n=1 Tax=Gordonia phage Rabbitrun TaxID=2762280 RepID=A0A7G8LII8_9CAUD|nr:capsid maturation protease [Gordonia phage Rabbitrun]QNJ57060.1 capsid maturation protease [Gordonia phage Rabbitrun]